MVVSSSGKNSERVFVVHGRNAAARDAMFTFLRSIGLKPIEWDQAIALTGKASPYIGEVLDLAFDAAQAVVVLLTPDDIAYIRREYAAEDDPELEPRGQARPNVLFEAGMAMGRNAERTVLVEMGDLRPFSDVGGRHAIRMDNTPQRRKSLADRLQTAGCPVDVSGSDWINAGDFTPPSKPGNGLSLGKRLPARERNGANVDGHWYAGSGSSFDHVKVTNIGGVPIYDIRLEVPENLADHIQLHGNDTVATLPVGKSFTVRGWTSNRTLGGGAPNQFELRAVGRLDSGDPFEQNVYFDAVGR